MIFRAANAGDMGLITRATLENLNWQGAGFHSEDIRREPQFAHYLSTFVAPGDFGVVAEEDGLPAGVCWAVTLPASDAGYGFVSDDIPEVSVTVFEPFRRRGIGRELLAHLIDEAGRRGCSAISLSVEDGNPARELYESLGFTVVGRSGTSDTMLLRLG
ncbi:MAG: GNAT family N-acetyltransferase [Actinomycetales bacterium]|nr:GNAT family N-acetyltransferase [Actinomycetales bacterium]